MELAEHARSLITATETSPATSKKLTNLSRTEEAYLGSAIYNAVLHKVFGRMTDDVAVWFAATTVDFVIKRIRKMIDGQRKYGGNFLKDVNHAAELQPEILDAINYHYGFTYNPYASNGSGKCPVATVALRKPKSGKD